MSWDSPGWKETRAEYHANRLKEPQPPNKPIVVMNTAKVTKPSPLIPALDSTKASAYQIRGITWFWPGRFALGSSA
jgi:hypothetical protein